MFFDFESAQLYRLKLAFLCASTFCSFTNFSFFWKMKWSTMTRAWDKEKIRVPTGIEPMTSRTPGGRSIHWATRTHGVRPFNWVLMWETSGYEALCCNSDGRSRNQFQNATRLPSINYLSMSSFDDHFYFHECENKASTSKSQLTVIYLRTTTRILFHLRTFS